ncbi:MAG: recombinase family protein [Gammaproteobacteria bacterium]|nr:MAG: recombinase family protein [Gammaproteobacteria bacterium]
MNESKKIQPHHIERDAYLYIRQSSMRQVIENTESGKRQYALRTRAIALGWPEDRIVVIDSDQGESGSSASWRSGFQRLVSDVGMGKAGIVMGLEVSRLARNNADWHRLLEICGLSETLILDEDGVYDPLSFNDRLLLGLKGAMSEAELHVLKARLRGGILNKVRRGEYRCMLPTGLVYDEAGNVILDPDSQVRETIEHFFETFSRVGSACQTVKAFRNEGIHFPSRVRRQEGSRVLFRPLTASTALRTLYNPRYAGTYAYGRRRYRRSPNGKRIHSKRDCNDWHACIPDAHPGYITWKQYQANIELLKANGKGYELARRSPPREGAALLQGRAICGRCGRFLHVRYISRRGGTESSYICNGATDSDSEPTCQSIAGGPVDAAIGVLIAEKVTPAAVQLAFEVRREIEARHQEADQLRCRAVERAQIEADMAQRRFMMVDPGNRLVADTLEADWNDKLRTLAKGREDRERQRQDDERLIDNATQDRLVAMTTMFKKLWDEPTTPNRERKRMLSHIIEDVTLVKIQEEGVTKIHVRFKGGKTTTLTSSNLLSSAQMIKTPTKVVELVDQLLDDHIYEEIAKILNDQGLQPGGSARKGREGASFTATHVAYLANTYKLQSRRDRLRLRGMLTKTEIAKRLGVHEATVVAWAKHGIVKRHAYSGLAYLYEDPGQDPPKKQCSRWNRLADRACATKNQLAHVDLKEV